MNAAETPVLESPAYPTLLRTLAVVAVVDLLALGAWSLPTLRSAQWSATALALGAVAFAWIVWMGGWIVASRTRLEGETLTQTWLWRKRVRADEVTQLRLVHLPGFDRIVAPRLLVRRRGGAIGWFHAADARLLTTFAERVTHRQAARG